MYRNESIRTGAARKGMADGPDTLSESMYTAIMETDRIPRIAWMGPSKRKMHMDPATTDITDQ